MSKLGERDTRSLTDFSPISHWLGANLGWMSAPFNSSLTLNSIGGWEVRPISARFQLYLPWDQAEIIRVPKMFHSKWPLALGDQLTNVSVRSAGSKYKLWGGLYVLDSSLMVHATSIADTTSNSIINICNCEKPIDSKTCFVLVFCYKMSDNISHAKKLRPKNLAIGKIGIHPWISYIISMLCQHTKICHII